LGVCLAGRLAEELFCHDITSGAQNDIAKATEIAKKMVLDWGMSEQLGMINYANDDKQIMPMDLGGKDYSDKTAELIDEEVRKIMSQAEHSTRELLENHRDAADRLARALLKYETLSADEAKQIIEGMPLSKPTVNDLLDAERKKPPSASEPVAT